jgi:hypothetical protein
MVFKDPTEEVSIVCLICNTEMPAIAKFCGKCGAPRAQATGMAQMPNRVQQPTNINKAPVPQQVPTQPTGLPTDQLANPGNVFSIVGMSLGGISILFLPILFGPIAIGLSIAALVKKEKLGGLALGLSIGGTTMGMILGFLFWTY